MAKKNKFLPGQSLAGLLLFCFLGIFLTFGFTYVSHSLLPELGVNMQKKVNGVGVLLILIGGSLLGSLLVYAAVIVWMIFCKPFFTRAQIEAIMNYGPTTRFDRWLLNKFFPERPKL